MRIVVVFPWPQGGLPEAEEAHRRSLATAAASPGHASARSARLVAQLDGAPVTVFAFDVVGARIKHISVPEKLRAWTTG